MIDEDTFLPESAEEAAPYASSMIETMRSIGYDLETALADIIDNSISAGAKNIEINFEWLHEASWLTVSDDGLGMNGDDLIEAMRLGGMGPSFARTASDLGRFGLGMKTASFSQCRKLTVTTKKNNFAVCSKTWDLDYVSQNNSWTLVKYPVGDLEEQWLSTRDHGTVVRWNSLDRLAEVQSSGSAASKTRFFDRITSAQWHLEMVFHHFLERGIDIKINGHPLKPWNPFVTGPPPQPLSEEFCGVALVGVRPYVLPHHTKYDDKTSFTRAGGPKGWNDHQGFYIYRNDRLLVPGTWLGFYKKDEHCKLARIKVDISSELDAEWELDIKKSVARPPAEIRSELKRIGMTTRNEAQSVYRHRGLRTAKTKGIDRLFKVWNEQDRNSGRAYIINRTHPLLEDLKTISNGLWSSISSVLKLIEESLPITHIVMREAEDPDSNIPQYDGLSDAELIQIARTLQKPLTAQGLSPDQIKTHLILVEPFNYRPEILENL